MANAAGGHIIYGIRDKRGEDNQSTGIAEGLAGLSLSTVQTEIARFSNLIRNSIAPRLTGIAMQTVTHTDGDVLVIHIPKSWSRPHMVTIDGVNKFFGRVATGKYPMSVDEIGRAFSEQGELREMIARWRAHRVELALKDKGPMLLAGEVTMLFHVIPESAFMRRELRGTWRISDQEANCIYVPHRGTNRRYNADGFIASARAGNALEAYGYAQLFRSSRIMEYADSGCFRSIGYGTEISAIYGQFLEQQMVQCYKDAITRIRKEDRTEALYIGFSLIGIADKRFHVSLLRGQVVYIDNPNVFISPEVFVDPNEPDEHPFPKTLLPLVDTMWQVTGLDGTPFKLDGEWKPFHEWQ